MDLAASSPEPWHHGTEAVDEVMEAPEVPDTITCVECGGECHRMSHPPPEVGFSPGDVVVYACADCDHRLDVLVEEDGEAP